MPILSLSDLFTPLNETQVRDTLYSTLTALGFSVTSWRSGGIARTIIAAVARTIAAFTGSLVEGVIKSGFIDYASGTALSILADQFYNVQREDASFATGFETLTKPSGPIFGPYLADEVTFQVGSSGPTYRNSAPFTFGMLDTEITIPIYAIEPGSASTAAPGQIDHLVTTMSGVTCANANALVGIDEETDASLRIRCKDKLKSLSPNGPPEVYDYVARSSKLNGGVHVTRTQVLADHDAGEVTLYIADEAGAISAPNVALVQAGIDRWAVPQCTEAIVASASTVTVPVTIDVYVSARAGLDGPTAQTRGADGLTTWFQAAPIGGVVISPAEGKLYANAVLEAAAALFPERLKVDMSAPAGDVDLGEGVVAVLGTVTVNLHQVTT